MAELIDRMRQPDFFRNLEGILDWFGELYASYPPTPMPASLSALLDEGLSRFGMRPEFPVDEVLSTFEHHGFRPNMRVGFTGETTSQVSAEFIIGQALADVCGLNPNRPPWTMDEPILNRIAMWKERFGSQ